jgi:hypothetical protein
VWRLVLLLGFDPAAYMKLEGIRDAEALGPKMFASQSPNKSGLICVLHHLFGVLDPAYKEVRGWAGGWPAAVVWGTRTFEKQLHP